jgi:hypothetical protein
MDGDDVAAFTPTLHDNCGAFRRREKRGTEVYSCSVEEVLGVSLGMSAGSAPAAPPFAEAHSSGSTQAPSRSLDQTKRGFHTTLCSHNVPVEVHPQPNPDERKSPVEESIDQTSFPINRDPPHGGQCIRYSRSDMRPNRILVPSHWPRSPTRSTGPRREFDGRKPTGATGRRAQLDALSTSARTVLPTSTDSVAAYLCRGECGGRDIGCPKSEIKEQGRRLDQHDVLHQRMCGFQLPSSDVRILHPADVDNARKERKTDRTRQTRVSYPDLGRSLRPSQAVSFHALDRRGLRNIETVETLLGHTGIYSHDFGIKVTAIRRYEDQVVYCRPIY